MNQDKRPRWKSGKFAKASTKKWWNRIKTAAVIYVAYLYFQPALIEIWARLVPETVTITLWVK